MDDFSNFGWVMFLKDKSGPAVLTAFRGFLASIKPLIQIHGSVGCIGSLRTDNEMEFINDDFKDMLTEANIRREQTPVGGAKHNGRVEWKLALIRE